VTLRVIIGIDPSLTATGIAVLQRPDSGRGRWSLFARATVGAPSTGPLVTRLATLETRFTETFRRMITGRYDVLVVAEDPSDFRIPGKGGPSQRFRFGAGVGVVLVAAARVCTELSIPLETYGTKEWLPMQSGRRGGSWRHNVPHAAVIAQTCQLVPGLEGATDDETMAAALALWRALQLQVLPTRARRGAARANVLG
jgi:hypothetical protein